MSVTRVHRAARIPTSQPQPPGAATTLLLLAAAGALVSCAAPGSRPAEGAIAHEIQASLDSGKAVFPHDAWEQLLSTGTYGGRVDYGAFQTNRSKLDAYLERLAKADLGSLDPQHLLALLLNAYNALTIRTILDHPQVSSIKEIDGVWDKIKHRVGGFDLTLDEIEHNLIRPFFRDPRIHFAVNCASESCAPLYFWSFEGAKLEAQLDYVTQRFLDNPANVYVEDDRLYVSRYFDWYGEDFIKEDWDPRADTVALFIIEYIQHTQPPVAEFVRAADGKPKIEYLDYDWSLNAHTPRDRSQESE